MFWNKPEDKSRDLENSRQNLKAEIDDEKTADGFFDKAADLRGGRRGSLSIDDVNAKQIINEESDATESAQKKKPRNYQEAEELAEEVVDKPWWKR